MRRVLGSSAQRWTSLSRLIESVKSLSHPRVMKSLSLRALALWFLSNEGPEMLKTVACTSFSILAVQHYIFLRSLYNSYLILTCHAYLFLTDWPYPSWSTLRRSILVDFTKMIFFCLFLFWLISSVSSCRHNLVMSKWVANDILCMEKFYNLNLYGRIREDILYL